MKNHISTKLTILPTYRNYDTRTVAISLTNFTKMNIYTFTSAEDMYAEIALAAFSLMVSCGFDRSVNTTSCIWLDIYTGAGSF